ncbi:MAG: hypothetical protein ACQXXG_05610 [Candidatus Bathyarchaeia archaeon]|jgi:hypothetical protein
MRLGKLRGWFQFKGNFIIIFLWIILVSIVVIVTYHSIYLTSERWKTFKIAWDPVEGPVLNNFGIALLFVVSFSVGLLLEDAKTLVYGFLLTLVLSFIISVTFVFYYIWNFLNFSESLGKIPYGWEWALYMSFLNCIRIFIPHVLVLLIFGAGLGCLLSSYFLIKK